MSTKLLVFNWKMNPVGLKEALPLAKISDYKNTVIAPPFPFLREVGKVLKKSKLAAQDLFWENPPAGGAYTGEVSASELRGAGVSYVIVGHSERRSLGETDEIIAKKAKTALASNLIPIICVGESLNEKKAGKKEEVISRQLRIGLSLVGQIADGRIKAKSRPLIIAYEPVWAIGTGDPETPESALEIIRFIKASAKSYLPYIPKVLYGGSVNSKNLGNYIKYKEIDGSLVGGASLNKKEVSRMIKYL